MAETYNGTWTEGDGTVHEKDQTALDAYNIEVAKLEDDELNKQILELEQQVDPNDQVNPTPTTNQYHDGNYDAMTNDELLAAISGLEQEMPQENRYESLLEFYGDRVEEGITATPSMVGASIKTILVDPFEKGIPDSFGELYDRFGENFMNYQHGYQDMFNLTVDKTGKKAPNEFHKYVGAGVSAFSDPYGLLVKTGGKLTAVLGRAVGLQTIGMTAQAGGDIGGTIEEAVTGEPETGSYRTVGSLLGVIPGAVISKPMNVFAVKTAQSLFKKYKDVKGDPSAVSDAYATSYVKGIMKRIVEENPNIETILTDLNKIGVKWDAKEFPLIAAANQSPTAHSQLVKLARENATYRYGFQEELKRMAGLVESNADRIFGSRYTEFPWSDASIKKGLLARQQRLIKARANIDDRIIDLQERLDPSMSDADVGMAIKKLVDKRESLARLEVGPLYEVLKDEAADAGVHVPADTVGDFYYFVEANATRDLFGKLTDVDKQVFKKMKPKIKVENGIEIPEFKELSFAQVESLKRAINELKRMPLSTSEQRKLLQFEKEFSGVRKSMKTRDGAEAIGFDDRLKGVDKIFYEKVGVPFSVEAIAQIGKKRYTSDVANVILKNQEAIDQYLNAAGKEGPILARDAMIAKLHSKAVVNGILDPRKLKKEMAKNKVVIDRIPGMKAELDNLSLDADYLGKRMATLDDALKVERKKVADHFLSTTEYAPNYETLTANMIKNPSALKKFKIDIKMLDRSTKEAVMQQVRRSFVENLKKHDGGAFKFMTDPKNKKILNDVMGDGYTQDLKDFAKVIDAMKGIDVNKLGAVVNKAELDAVAKVIPGVDSKYASSQWRDRISSPIMKLTRIFSKMMDFKSGKAMDRSVYELLMDRDGMNKVRNAVARMGFKIDTPMKVQEITGLIKEILPVYMYTAEKTTTMDSADKAERKIQ